ncbi:MAG TPA: HAD hydrolase family protein [Candidatus Dormibacteraeota bacterium]|nr:HAD hydrolase family protein [Candidatus Dormibacteraeota bacterium]
MSPPRVDAPGAPRPGRRPELVALDLDGTCLDQQQRLAPRTRDAVRAAVAAGVAVVIATGRMYRSALPWAREMGVTAPLLCYQGALVRALPDGNGTSPPGPVLFEDPVPPDVAEHALQIARAGNWHYQAYQDDLLLCEEDRPEAHLYSRIAQVEIHFVDDLVPVLRRGSTKVVCVVEDPAGAARCEAAMREGLAGAGLVTRSLPQFVEITNPVASKGRALTRLCDRLGIPLGAVVAVGDAPNDSDMLRVAGYSVAVDGAPDRLLVNADATCAPADQAGVADVLVALGLTS